MQEFSVLSHLDPQLTVTSYLSITHNWFYPSAFSETISFERFVITLEPFRRHSYGQIIVLLFSAILQCNGIWNRGGAHCSHILLRKVLIITGNFATVTWFLCTGSLQVVTFNWLTLNHFNLSNPGRVFSYVALFLSEERITVGILTLYKNNQNSSFVTLFKIRTYVRTNLVWDSPVFSIVGCLSYVGDAKNTLVGPVGPF